MVYIINKKYNDRLESAFYMQLFDQGIDFLLYTIITDRGFFSWHKTKYFTV